MATEAAGESEYYCKHYFKMPDDDLIRLAADVANLVPEAREALRIELMSRKIPCEDIDWTVQRAPQKQEKSGGIFRRFLRNIGIFAVCWLAGMAILFPIVSYSEILSPEAFASLMVDVYVRLALLFALLFAIISFPKRVRTLWIIGAVGPLVGLLIFLALTPANRGNNLASVRQLAESGNASAQYNLGRIYFIGKDVPKDYVQAATWFQKAAEQGDANAQLELGLLLSYGYGVPQDYAQAAIWFQKSADQGNPEAQAVLGRLYEIGQGVQQDYPLAADLYRRAAGQGNAFAQSALATLYETGQGVHQDYTVAADWYRKAAEQGNANAETRLGVFYENGKGGVPKDYDAAAIWYRKAAEQGNTEAQLMLGLLYELGRGFPQNEVEAHFWFVLAASGQEGREQILGEMSRDRTAKHLTPSELSEVQARAEKWAGEHPRQ
jgi:TPR repeat protein